MDDQVWFADMLAQHAIFDVRVSSDNGWLPWALFLSTTDAKEDDHCG